MFSRIKCLLAALLGTSLVRRVRLCAGTSSDASYTPKLILKKVNEMSQWAMPLRLAIQACSLHWRSSIVICKAVIADRNGIASSRSCLKRFVAPNSIVLCNSVSVDGSGVSVYRFPVLDLQFLLVLRVVLWRLLRLRAQYYCLWQLRVGNRIGVASRL